MVGRRKKRVNSGRDGKKGEREPQPEEPLLEYGVKLPLVGYLSLNLPFPFPPGLL